MLLAQLIYVKLVSLEEERQTRQQEDQPPGGQEERKDGAEQGRRGDG